MPLARRFDFSGGEQLKTSRFLRAKNQVALSQNCQFDTIGSIEKRRGYSLIGAQISAGQEILMNKEFEYGTTPTRKHIVICDGAANSEVYINVSGTWTSQSQSLTKGERSHGASLVDHFFLVNLSDATRSYNGTTWSTSTNVTNAPKAKFVESYKTRLYLAYCDISGTVYPSRVYYSSLPDSSDALTWDTTNDWFQVETNDGDAITGLTKNSGYLIVFKNYSMHRYDGTFGSTNLRPVSWQFGAVNQNAIVTHENLTFFYDRKGVCLYAGSKPKLISRPIQPIIDRVRLTNFRYISGGISGDHVLFFVGDLLSALPGYSSVPQNVVLDYDMAQDIWTHHTCGDELMVFNQYTSLNKKLLSAGSLDGEVFTWGTGGDDNGTAVETDVRFEMWPSGPETLNTFQNAYFFGNNMQDLDFQFQVDDDGVFSTAKDLTGSYTKDDFGNAVVNPYGRNLLVKLSDGSTDKIWRLDGMSVEYESEALEIKES